MISRLSPVLLLACTFAAAFPATLHAQIDRAQINGTVTDNSGAVVLGAEIDLLQEGTGATRHVVSGGQGSFVLASLPVGRYTMTVNKAGFADLRVGPIDLNAGVNRTINARLRVASAT